jgi:hypothetical protein
VIVIDIVLDLGYLKNDTLNGRRVGNSKYWARADYNF